MQTINRKYKDSVFRTLFSDEDKLIELYNALFDTNYGPEANIEIVTLEDVVFRVLKNDVAFVMEDSFIVLAEHQSTICNNMPLRDLIYMSAMLQRMINTDELYRKKLLKIPRPTFIVFYDGKEDFPEYHEMKLSDAFLGDDDEIALQLTVRVYNINIECGILPEFLKKYGTEMVEMLFRELTREEYMEISRLDGYDDGLEEGLRKGRAEGEAVTLGVARNALEYDSVNVFPRFHYAHTVNGRDYPVHSGQGIQTGEIGGVSPDRAASADHIAAERQQLYVPAYRGYAGAYLPAETGAD